MFVQIMRGTTSEPGALTEHMERWERELGPGATGWLGATSGVSPDGEFVTLARFESEHAARQNSERPEQGEWYQGLVGLLDGEPSFVDSTDVEVLHDGGSDRAGFVQVMEVRPTDPARYRELAKQSEEVMGEHRPDVLGGFQVWHPGGQRCTEFIYFTSEQEAREAEQRELTGEAKEMMEEWQSLEAEVDYIDLPEPRLSTP